MGFSTFDFFKQIPVECEGIVYLEESHILKIHQILLEILDDIVEVCEEYDIGYFLGGGSALGAMRHKGFIPWDDDMDINMPRKDYDRFIPLFRERFQEKYWIHTPQDTENYALSMTQIRKKGTVMKGRDDFATSECGVGIDIFVIENAFDNKVLRNFQGIVSLMLGYLLSCRKFYRDRKEILSFLKKTQERKGTIYFKIAVGFLIAWIPVTWWCKATDNWHRICKDDHSQWVCGCAGRLHFFGELYKREGFCEVRKEMFEGRMLNVSQDVEGYLEHCYGDWKKLPSPEKRERHIVFELEL